MKTFHDYESMGALQNIEESEVPVLETLSGSQVVSWYTMIDDFLQRKLDDQEAARNHENADRLRAFLNTWRDNELTGSLSVDQLIPLKAASEQAAAVKSPLRTIFTSILRNLRKLIADEEQLPRGVDPNAVNPMSAGGLGSAPPMSPDFGPEEEAPTDLEGGAPGLEQPGEQDDENLDKVMSAAEMESTGSPLSGAMFLKEDQATDIALYQATLQKFQQEAGQVLDGTSMDAFKQWLKKQLTMNVRNRIMCIVMFKRIVVNGEDENTAWQAWIQREPGLKAAFENDPDSAKYRTLWDRK